MENVIFQDLATLSQVEMAIPDASRQHNLVEKQKKNGS